MCVFPRNWSSISISRGNLRRVVCIINQLSFNCALFPNKQNYLIVINKKLRQNLDLAEGDVVNVELAKDESKYGFPMPKEFAEVLRRAQKAEQCSRVSLPGKPDHSSAR